jgi:hypothetical protein
MIVQATQRWLNRYDVFRHPDEPIRTAECDVGPAPWAQAKAFVETHHYSDTFASSVFRFGLFRKGRLVGVANFGNAVNDRALTNVFGTAHALELNRFVLLDEVEGMGETWFLARCFRLLSREGVAGVLSFSDPTARTDASGRTVFKGHIGTIYQALSWSGRHSVYLGRATPRTLKVLPDGRVFNEKQMSKIRTLDQGVDYCVRALVGQAAGDGVAFPPGLVPGTVASVGPRLAGAALPDLGRPPGRAALRGWAGGPLGPRGAPATV